MPNPSRETKFSGAKRGQGNIVFPCSADRVQDWQPYPVDPYSCYICVTLRTYIVDVLNEGHALVRGTSTIHVDIDVDTSSLCMFTHTVSIVPRFVREGQGASARCPASHSRWLYSRVSSLNNIFAIYLTVCSFSSSPLVARRAQSLHGGHATFVSYIHTFDHIHLCCTIGDNAGEPRVLL